MAVDTIKDGMVVGLAYKLTVEGQVIESADADEPLEYLHGAENIVPGLEERLTGKKVGDKLSVTLQPEEAYGDYEEDDLETIERNELPEIEVGMELLLEDDEGYFMEATVKEVNDDTVVLDFNPPLAGKVVDYEVEVISIREADDDELAHGHPHGVDDDDFEDYE